MPSSPRPPSSSGRPRGPRSARRSPASPTEAPRGPVARPRVRRVAPPASPQPGFASGADRQVQRRVRDGRRSDDRVNCGFLILGLVAGGSQPTHRSRARPRRRGRSRPARPPLRPSWRSGVRNGPGSTRTTRTPWGSSSSASVSPRASGRDFDVKSGAHTCFGQPPRQTLDQREHATRGPEGGRQRLQRSSVPTRFTSSWSRNSAIESSSRGPTTRCRRSRRAHRAGIGALDVSDERRDRRGIAQVESDDWQPAGAAVRPGSRSVPTTSRAETRKSLCRRATEP